MTTAQVVNDVKTTGVGRTQAFEALAELERAGIVERRRRGVVAIGSVARSFLPTPPRRSQEPGGERPNGD